MPPPLLTTVSARARRAFPIIERGVRQGLSANQIQSVLRAGEGGIRRQSLLDIMRGVRGVEASGKQLRSLNRQLAPDPRRLPDALTKLRRQFSFKVKISGFDIETGADVIRFVNVSLADVLTRSQIESIGLGFIEDDMQRYGTAVTDVLIESGVKSGVEGTLT